jgi:hypothetical protein
MDEADRIIERLTYTEEELTAMALKEVLDEMIKSLAEKEFSIRQQRETEDYLWQQKNK